jgi:protein-disulfide isomerase
MTRRLIKSSHPACWPRALVVLWLLCALTHPAGAQANVGAASSWTPSGIAEFVRHKYGLPPRAVIEPDAIRPSPSADFVETTILIRDDGPPSHKVFTLSADGKYVIDSAIYRLQQSDHAISDAVRQEQFRGSSEYKIAAGELKPADKEGFWISEVSISGPRIEQVRNYYVTKDKGYLIPGSIFTFRSFEEDLRLAASNAGNALSVGRSDAPVLIVMYTDYQCPDCARVHSILTDHVIPKYGSRIKILYKDFPLPYHQWARKAAAGIRCINKLAPQFVPAAQADLFAMQEGLTQESIEVGIADIAGRANLPPETIRECMADRNILDAIQQDVAEGLALELAKTPTVFVGSTVLGGRRPATDLDAAIEEALKATPGAGPAHK